MTDLDLALPAIVDAHAARRPDDVALVFDSGAVSYGELADRSARAAGLLRAEGVRAGDRVALALGTAPDLPIALLGAARLGAIVVPLNHRHRGDVLRYMVGHAAPSATICDPGVVDEQQLADIRASAPGAVALEACGDGSRFLAMLDGADADFAAGRPLDPVAIVYTSGTTGRSKGAVLSQTFMLLEADAFLQVVEPRASGEVFWTALPLFHTNALCLTMLGALVAGQRAVLRHGFSASRFWEQVGADGATVVNLLGAMVPILLKGERDAGEHTVRLAVGGGVPVDAVRAFSERFHVEFREIYGMTETGLNAGQTATTRKAGSVGRPLRHWDVRVDAGAGKDGEIQVRGRRPGALLDAYWDDVERTREAFTTDGWFRTGDLGAVDADGYLRFRGRIKDCIRRRGENISPTEVELAVSRHPAIAECAAVAVPSELAEDEVKVAYVLRPGARLTARELHDFCRREMAGFMVPRYLEELPALSKTPTEKIERHRLVGIGDGVHDMAASSHVASAAGSRRG